MRVFILGGTGSIGTAIVSELIARAHDVTALSRSQPSDRKLQALGAQLYRGDLTGPYSWVGDAVACDAIIHVAATFGDDMGAVDRAVVSELMRAAEDKARETRLLYTGGCWMYGETGDDIATEDRAFDPLPAFAWMAEHGEELLKAPGFATAIVHPAMVYHDDGGGVFGRFTAAAQEGRRLEISGSPQTRWPIIERTDLARAYCDLLVRPDLTGHFNAVSQEGVRVGEIARSIAQVYGAASDAEVLTVEDLVREHGAWAKGPTLDQQMSARKLKRLTSWKPRVTDYRMSAFMSRGGS